MILYTSIAVFLFSALALIAKSGYSLGAAMLFFGSVVLLWKRPLPALKREDRILIGVLLFYFAVSVVANLAHHASMPEYDVPLRFVLAIPALLLLLAFPPDSRAIWGGFAVGAILAGCFTGWQNLVLGHVRAGGYTNPIQYGNISVLLGMLCLTGLEWAQSQRRRKLWMGLLLAGTIMGSMGALFTGSRGSWISIPICLVALCFAYKTMLNRRVIMVAVSMIVGIFAISYFIPRTGVEGRLKLVSTQTEAYFSDHEAETSLGARFEMWRTGLMIFPERPWIGWGKQGLIDRAKTLADAGKIDPVVTRYTHLHNDYIDALVKRGLPGLLAVLFLYFVPLQLFAKKTQSADRHARVYALGGVALCLSYLGFGLTDAFLTHNNGVMVYAFVLVLLWSQGHHYERKAELRQ